MASTRISETEEAVLDRLSQDANLRYVNHRHCNTCTHSQSCLMPCGHFEIRCHHPSLRIEPGDKFPMPSDSDDVVCDWYEERSYGQ